MIADTSNFLIPNGTLIVEIIAFLIVLFNRRHIPLSNFDYFSASEPCPTPTDNLTLTFTIAA